jgi:hypothetical protein
MNLKADPMVEIEEATSLLIPEDGVSVYQAIQDAQLSGYQKIEIAEDRMSATITWYKKPKTVVET